jgi:hypothetical protein
VGWEHRHHRCRTPAAEEIRDEWAGQGSIWVCECSLRWRLVLNVGRASWFCLNNEEKRWVGEI